MINMHILITYYVQCFVLIAINLEIIIINIYLLLIFLIKNIRNTTLLTVNFLPKGEISVDCVIDLSDFDVTKSI